MLNTCGLDWHAADRRFLYWLPGHVFHWSQAHRKNEMKYMLLIYGDEGCWTEEERRDCMAESMAIGGELAAQGKYIASAPLHSVTTATSLRVQDGKRIITDGPFAETTEQLGGYYIIDVEHLDEAIDIAARLPPAKKGTVEIRPVFDVTPLRTSLKQEQQA